MKVKLTKAATKNLHSIKGRTSATNRDEIVADALRVYATALALARTTGDGRKLLHVVPVEGSDVDVEL